METIFVTFGLLQRFQILFRKLLEHEIIAQTARRIAGAFFFLEDAEGGAQVVPSRARTKR